MCVSKVLSQAVDRIANHVCECDRTSESNIVVLYFYLERFLVELVVGVFF